MDHGSHAPDRLTRLVPARLAWDGDQPRSVAFDDIYHAADGAAEVRRVFIEPNRLHERFGDGSTTFRIGELGFGTGLNFIVAATLFLDRAPVSSRLHFVSFEAHPLTHGELKRLAARRAAELPLYRELAHVYPPLIGGWHRRHLCGGRVTLSIFFGDGAQGLTDLTPRSCAPMDAWFLDGFAPDRNPALWSDPVLRAVAALSGERTTLATFTAAGRVRRGLEAVGYAAERVDQRPFKRHTLRATFNGRPRMRPTPPADVAVLGSGLAGCATARALAERGIDVRLLERAVPTPNRLRGALLHPRLTARGMDWRARAFAYAAHRLIGLAGVERTGALQFTTDGFASDRLERIAEDARDTDLGVARVSPAAASGLIGSPVRAAALHFRDACTIDLARLCDALVEHSAIAHETDAPRDARTVVCTGAAVNDGVPDMRVIEGQVDVLVADGGPLLPIVGDGFASPLGNDVVAVGATYEHRRWETARATAFNRERVARFFARLGLPTRIRAALAPMRGVRAVTRDRLPVISRVHDDNVWLNVGHGSTGTITAPLAAECIAAELAGDFAPLTLAELAIFDARRFTTRRRRITRTRGR